VAPAPAKNNTNGNVDDENDDLTHTNDRVYFPIFPAFIQQEPNVCFTFMPFWMLVDLERHSTYFY